MIDVQNFKLLVIPTQTPNTVILSEAKDLTYARPISHRQASDPPAIVRFLAPLGMTNC